MKLKDTVYLALAAVAIIIGIHRSLIEGVLFNYWLFMFGFIFLMLYRYEVYKRKVAAKEAMPPSQPPKAKASKKRPQRK